jgi:pyruvate-formate lyase
MSAPTLSTYAARIEALHQTKLDQTEAKIRVGRTAVVLHGDIDDKGQVLPPDGWTFEPESNHPSGSFFGPVACGHNFRRLLESHPTYIDPNSSLAGAWMTHLTGYQVPSVPPEPEFRATHLVEEQQRYNILPGIYGIQHFGPDIHIGFELGWGGMLEKVRRYRAINPDRAEWYDGWEDVILGIQNWVGRHADAAREAALIESEPELRENLEAIATICAKQVTDPPETFREACQWLAWFEMAASMYNTSGALGQIDELLRPYYERDVAAGILDDDEATYHLASLLVKETHYSQIGGLSPEGDRDMTSRVSFLVLEAAHLLRIPSNVAIRVHEGLDPELFDTAIRHLFEDKTGSPIWMGGDALDEGFARNGYPIELARQRCKVGCHWCALPGREYTLNDVVKINFAKVFEVAFFDTVDNKSADPNVEAVWASFSEHMRKAVRCTAEGIDFHLAHMKDVFPEMFLDLFCHGTIEQGRDVTDGGVEFYNMCIDGSALATVADSFAAIDEFVERTGQISWERLAEALRADFVGYEDVHQMLSRGPRYGGGNTRGDWWAQRVSQDFSEHVKERPTPGGRNLIPGLFSWASTIGLGQAVGATPNGRHAHAPISHGPNPDPGFASSNAPTEMARAVASVQSGWGNTAPLQLDMDPMTGNTESGRMKIGALIRGHFDLGGTMINLNVVDKEQILAAHENPELYPDLVVRVTGFSAYFASLSKEFRQLVVDRIVAEDV